MRITVKMMLAKTGTPPGNVVMRIRKVSDDSIIATSDSKVAASLQLGSYREETFLFTNVDLLASTAYYVAVEYSEAGSSGANYVAVGAKNGDTPHYWKYAGSWTQHATHGASFYLEVSVVNTIADFTVS